MATKTIGIKEGVYDRLVAAKRPDESFSDTIDRLLEASAGDWREGFGTYDEETAGEMQAFLRSRRADAGRAHEGRQQRSEDELDSDDDANR
jgi:predicted CopG family antitoxin